MPQLQSAVDYVSFELFRIYHLKRNKGTTDERIKRFWETARQSYWRDQAVESIAAVKRWEEMNELALRVIPLHHRADRP